MNKEYTKTTITYGASRVELHDALKLTGAEVSINNLPAGSSVPFVHAHKQNEEIYGILSGHGTLLIDGQLLSLNAGDWLRLSPQVKRQISAASDSPISFICIQVKEGSLSNYTMSDTVLSTR